MDNQRQKRPCRYVCRKPLGFSCFSRVPERARQPAAVAPFPSAPLFSFARVSFHHFHKPRPLRLDVFVHCAAAFGREAQRDLSAVGSGTVAGEGLPEGGGEGWGGGLLSGGSVCYL